AGCPIASIVGDGVVAAPTFQGRPPSSPEAMAGKQAVLSFLFSSVTVSLVSPEEIQSLIDEATFDYTMGDHDAALAKLAKVTSTAPSSFEAWHALAEINFNLRRFDDALVAAERAHAIRSDDLFINTTLSRVWMEKGDKAKAEHFGAQAKIQSWKEQ